MKTICSHCEGTGYDNRSRCMNCNGSGVHREESKSKKETLTVINTLVSDTKLTPSEKVERIYNLLRDGKQ